MQMIPSAEAIGHSACEASRAIGASAFMTCAAWVDLTVRIGIEE
jgi:hypothetical protein